VPAPVSRQIVDAFYEALAAACAQRDLARIVPFLHNDIEWTINGPVDVLTYCGARHGPVGVLYLIARVQPGVVIITAFRREGVLGDGDGAAALVRLTGVHTASGAIVSYRVAQFMRFCDNQVIEFHAVIDSFDAAEQVLGRPLELAPDASFSGGTAGDLVTV
jgi:ketosteroid isomerase-like protein